MTVENFIVSTLSFFIFGSVIVSCALRENRSAKEIERLRAQVARLAFRYERAVKGQPGAWMTTDHMRAVVADRRRLAAKISKPKEDPKSMTTHHLEREIASLRWQANDVWLAGRVKRAKELNKRADALAKIVRDRAQKATA